MGDGDDIGRVSGFHQSMDGIGRHIVPARRYVYHRDLTRGFRPRW
jgi:hypothetical protein